MRRKEMTHTNREVKTMSLMGKLTVSALAGALVLTSAAALTSAYAQEVKGPKVNWKFNVWGKKRAFTADVEAWNTYLKAKTGGNFSIKVYYGDQLGGNKQNLDNIKAGVFESAKICAAYHPGKNQSLTVLNMPFLPIEDFDKQRKVAEAVYATKTVQDELKSKWGVMVFSSSQLPQYEFMGKGRAPANLAEWKGLTVRALGGIADAMRKLGTGISTMTSSETYQAIDRGAVDAISLPFSYAHAAFKIDEVAEWFTSNLSPGTNDCPNVISVAAWEKLPPQYQKLMMEAKEIGYNALKEAYAKADKTNLPKWRARLKEIKYSKEELAKFQAIGGKPVYDKWIEDNKDKFDAKGLMDVMLAAAK